MQEERYGTRDRTKEPVALIETARDVGQEHKPVTVTRWLAVRAGLPCYVLLYAHAQAMNPADSQWHDIARFRVKRVWPKPETTWRVLEPVQWRRYCKSGHGQQGGWILRRRVMVSIDRDIVIK